MLSIGVELIAIFGFLVSPTSHSVVRVADRAVTVVLAPSDRAPAASTQHAAVHQGGLPRLQNPRRLLDDADIGTAINPRQAQGTGLSMSEANAAPGSPIVAAVASLNTEYLRRWQDRMERFGIAYYREVALQRIDLLSSSGAQALDKAAIHTVRASAPLHRFLQPLPAQLLSWLSSASGNFGGNIPG